MPRAVRVGLLALVSMVAVGCVRPPPPQVAKLRVEAVPDVTSVYVDDQYIGRARVLAAHPKELKPGPRFITFEAPGYFPHDVKLDLPPGETKLEMKLRPIPP